MKTALSYSIATGIGGAVVYLICAFLPAIPLCINVLRNAGTGG